MPHSSATRRMMQEYQSNQSLAPAACLLQVQQLKEQASAAHQAGKSDVAVRLLTVAIRTCALALDQLGQHEQSAATAAPEASSIPQALLPFTSGVQSALQPTAGLQTNSNQSSNGMGSRPQCSGHNHGNAHENPCHDHHAHYPQLQHLLSVLYSNRAAIHASRSAFLHSCVDAKLSIQQDPYWARPYQRLATAYLGLDQPHAALQALDQGIAACSSPHANTCLQLPRHTATPCRSSLQPQASALPEGLPQLNSHRRTPSGKTAQHSGIPPQSGAAKLTSSQPGNGVQQLQALRADVLVAARVAERCRQQQHRATKRARPMTPLLPPIIPTAPEPAAPEETAAAAAAAPEATATAAAAAAANDAPAASKRQDTLDLPQGPDLIAHCLEILDAAAAARGMTPGPQPDDKKVGITVLSGFLGSGKTTLLHRIVTVPPGNWPQNSLTCAGDGQQESHGSMARQQGRDEQLPDECQLAAETTRSVLQTHPPSSHREGAAAQARAVKFGLVVNDMAALNIDGVLTRNALRHVSEQPQQLDVMGPASSMAWAAGESVLSEVGTQQQAHGPQHLIELSNGCICCNLRGDMLLSVSQLLAAAPELTYLVVESTGVGQPLPIAAAFASTDTRGRSLLDYVRIDCMVTVVDAQHFMQLMSSTHTPASMPAAPPAHNAVAAQETLAAAQVTSSAPEAAAAAAAAEVTSTPAAAPAAAEAAAASADAGNQLQVTQHRQQVHDQSRMVVPDEDCKPLAELLAEQVEYANVVLVNKCDLLPSHTDGGPACQHSPSEAGDQEHLTTIQRDTQPAAVSAPLSPQQQIMNLIQALNARARVIATCYCDCPVTEVVNTHKFDYEAVESSARWQRELMAAQNDPQDMSDELSETQVYGIHSMVYECRAPFHPARLAAFINTLATRLRGSQQQQQEQQQHRQQQQQTQPTKPLASGLDGSTQQQQQQQQASTAGHIAQAVQGHSDVVPASLQPSLPSCLLRSKGFFWLASCPEVAWEWSTAGAACSFAPYGEWLAGKLPHRCWPADGSRRDWDSEWGDRRNSLAFIFHQYIDTDVVKTMLDECIMTAAEIAADVHMQPSESSGVKNTSGKSENEEKCEVGDRNEEVVECELSEDAMWFAREERWRQLPGANLWAQLLPH